MVIHIEGKKSSREMDSLDFLISQQIWSLHAEIQMR